MATHKTAIDWLSADTAFGEVRRQGARLIEMQAVMSRCVPGIALTVIALRDDAVVVGTRNTATAAKLRQQAPTVVAAMTAAGWPVARLLVRTQPIYGARPAPPAARRALPASALAALRDLQGTIEHEPTRRVLERMIARHQRGRS